MKSASKWSWDLGSENLLAWVQSGVVGWGIGTDTKKYFHGEAVGVGNGWMQVLGLLGWLDVSFFSGLLLVEWRVLMGCWLVVRTLHVVEMAGLTSECKLKKLSFLWDGNWNDEIRVLS